MLKNTVAIALILLFSAFSPAAKLCPKKKNTVIGKWTWVKTRCCYIYPKTKTPDSCQCSKSLELYKNGKYTIIKDGDTAESGVYTLKKGLDIMNPADQTPLINIGSSAPAIYRFDHDTLVLNRGYMDLETEYYVRKK